MKTVLTLPLLLWLTACAGIATYEQNAFRVIGTTATLVDGAMQGWGDYVRAGKAKPEEEAVVKQAYLAYQASMRTAKAAVESYRVAPNNDSLLRILDALDAAKNSLIDAIYAFKK